MQRRELLRSFAAVLAFGAAPGTRKDGPSTQAVEQLGTRDAKSKHLPGAKLNHVLIYVADVQQARAFYAEKFGFPQVFSFEQAGPKPGFTYLQISRDTFLELQPASDEHPPGIGHIGLEVANADDAAKALRESGFTVTDPRTSQQTHARITAVAGTAGVVFEVLEFPPDSLVRKAMNSWK